MSATPLEPEVMPGFRERPDGLLEYCGSTDESNPIEAYEAWEKMDATMNLGTWGQASIAASITSVWGESTVEDFAQMVEKSRGYIYKIARTYKYFTEESPRVHKLTFKHHTLSLSHPEPYEALLHAAENGYSCVRFEEWILNDTYRGIGKPRKKSAAVKIKENNLRTFLEHVEDMIMDDFIGCCPDRSFALRVFGPWQKEVRDENRQLYIEDVRDMVRNAVDERGACTVKEIVKQTGIKQGEIEKAVAWLVGQKEYEWIQKRGETEEARGTHLLMLHRCGASDGAGFTMPRAISNYSN